MPHLSWFICLQRGHSKCLWQVLWSVICEVADLGPFSPSYRLSPPDLRFFFFSSVKFRGYSESSGWLLTILLLFNSRSTCCHHSLKSETSVILAAHSAQSYQVTKLAKTNPQEFLHSSSSLRPPATTTIWGITIVHRRTAVVSYTGP